MVTTELDGMEMYESRSFENSAEGWADVDHALDEVDEDDALEFYAAVLGRSPDRH